MDYTNNSYDINISGNETIAFSIDREVWTGFYAFTPEYFCFVDGQRNGLSLITFKGGLPYFHNLNTVSTYNNFYGTQTDQVIRFVINEGEFTEKRFMALAVDSRDRTSTISGIKYSGDMVTTSDNQTSNIPIAAFTYKEGTYYSVFFRDTSLGATIQAGAGLRGIYAEINLVRDTTPAIQPLYSEFRSATGFYHTSEKAIT